MLTVIALLLHRETRIIGFIKNPFPQNWGIEGVKPRGLLRGFYFLVSSTEYFDQIRLVHTFFLDARALHSPNNP